MGRNSDRTQPCAKRTPTVPGELTKAVAAADVNQSGSLATDAVLRSDLVTSCRPSRVEENRNRAGAGSSRTNGFT